MHLLVVRHAIAVERDPADTEASDAERQLTGRGARKMRRAADGLRRVVPNIDLIATSPLVRAVETGEILSAAYGDIERVQTTVLSPGSPPEAFGSWVTRQEVSETLAVVGHEPDLSMLIGWLLCGAPRSMIELKKGAACLLDCGDRPAPRAATLLWSLRPGQLRRLRR